MCREQRGPEAGAESKGRLSGDEAGEAGGRHALRAVKRLWIHLGGRLGSEDHAVRAWEDPSAAVGKTIYSVKVEAEPGRKALHYPAEGGWCPGWMQGCEQQWSDADVFWNCSCRMCRGAGYEAEKQWFWLSGDVYGGAAV